MNRMNDLIQATKAGKISKEEMRKMQIEAFDFDWYSRLDKNVEQLEAFGSFVYKKVHDEITVSNPLDLFYEFDSGTLDSEYEVQFVTGGRVYDWAYGATRRRSPLKMQSWNVLQTPRQMAFEVEIQKLKTGRVLVADMVREAARAILAHKVKTGIDAFLASYVAGTTNTVNAASADITATVLESALRPTRGLAPTKAIVGHATALYPLTALAGYDASSGYPESAKEELHKKGMIGTYLGVPIVQLMDYTDPFYLDNPIATTNVWVVPNSDKQFNTYLEYGEVTPEPPETIQNQQLVALYWYWEDGAGLPTNARMLSYARRIYAAAVV